MKYIKFKEDYGEGIVIGCLILAALLSFASIIFLGERNLECATFSLGCVVLLVLGMLDNMLIINLITKTNELNGNCAWWRKQYEQEYCTCAKLRTKQTGLERELDITKCQLESSKKATQDANQQVRHLEAELSRLKGSKPKSDENAIKILKSPNKKKSNGDGYSLFLHNCGPSKLKVVKIIKDHIDYTLKETADLVNSAPCIIAWNISKDEANLIYNELTNEGASVSIRH